MYLILILIPILIIGLLSTIGDNQEFKNLSRYNQQWIDGYIEATKKKKKNKQKK